jgi:hypothetical protein
MARPLVWNGSAWADARVWDGSQWRAYVPPVYGANCYRDDFSAGPGPAGFTGGGGTDGTEFPVSNWANVHIYVDTRVGWAYAPYGTMKRVGSSAAPLGQWTVRSGQRVALQASLYSPLVSGNRSNSSGNIDLRVTLECPTISSGEVTVNAGINDPGGADWGWGVLTTASLDIPATSNIYKPHTLKMNNLEVSHYRSVSQIGDPTDGIYRLYMDWIRLIDLNTGVEIPYQTSPAVEPIKVYNGSAWV